MRTILVLALGCVAGCSNVNPIVRGPDPGGIPGGPGTAPPGRIDPRFPESDHRADGQPARTRRLCRLRGAPAGYIATAYDRSDDCPRADDADGYNVAIVEYYADRPIGATMIVCADQRTPRHWMRTADDPSGSCPGARVDAGEPTSVTIQRQY